MKLMFINFGKCQWKKIMYMSFIIMSLTFVVGLPNANATMPNTISFSSDPFGGAARTTPYDVPTTDFGLVTFKGTDDGLSTKFDSLSWMDSSAGMYYGPNFYIYRFDVR